MSRLAASLAVLALIGCEDFLPESVITKFRVIDLRAEPPEAAPGQTVRLDALIVSPTPEPATYAWLACEPAALVSPCDDRDLLLDRTKLLAASGVRNLGTSSVASYTFTGTIGADPKTAVVLLYAHGGSGDDVIARKEVTLSRSSSPNRNPAIEFLVVDMKRIDAGTDVLGAVGDAQEWSVITTSSSAQTYTAKHADGSTFTAIEDLRYEWFTTAGRFGTSIEPPSVSPVIDLFVDAGPPPRDAGPREGGGPSSVSEFGMKVTLNLPTSDQTPPPPNGPIHVWVVVRDARGGTAWTERNVELVDVARLRSSR